jgi:hypothetical protein
MEKKILYPGETQSTILPIVLDHPFLALLNYLSSDSGSHQDIYNGPPERWLGVVIQGAATHCGTSVSEQAHSNLSLTSNHHHLIRIQAHFPLDASLHVPPKHTPSFQVFNVHFKNSHISFININLR